MDGSRSHSVDKNNSSGRQTPQQAARQSSNDLFNFLGSSGLPGAFPQSLFPGSLFPFGPGFGSSPVGDGQQRNLDGSSADANGTDWWRIAAEQAKLLADYGNSFGGGLGANPFVNSLLMPPFNAYAASDVEQAARRNSSPAAHGSLHKSSTMSSSRNSASMVGAKSSPGTRDSQQNRAIDKSPVPGGGGASGKSPAVLRGTNTSNNDLPPPRSLTSAKDSSASAGRGSRGGVSSATSMNQADKSNRERQKAVDFPSPSSSNEHAKRSKHSIDDLDRRQHGESKNPVAATAASNLSDFYLHNPLLSAEAAAAQSAMFFPFGLPSPFGSSSLLSSPFTGSSLFPYLPSAAAGLGGSVFPPSSSLFGGADVFAAAANKSDSVSTPTSSHHHHSKMASSSSSGKVVSASTHGKTAPSSAATQDATERRRRSPHHHGSRNHQPHHDTDWRDVGGGGSGIVSRDMTSDSRKVQTDDKNRSRPVSTISKNPQQSSKSSTTPKEESLKYTDNGVMDLSMKKPRRSSPAPPTRTVTPRSSSASTTKPGGHDHAVEKNNHSSAIADQNRASLDMLNAFAQSHKAYAEQAAMMQFLTGHQLGGQSSGDSNADLSLSMAAAAALLPPGYDGLSGLFYPPSNALSALGSASASASSSHQQQLQQQTKGSSSSSSSSMLQGEKAVRNRRRGFKSPSSSNFISNLMHRGDEGERGKDGGGVKDGGAACDDKEHGNKQFYNHVEQRHSQHRETLLPTNRTAVPSNQHGSTSSSHKDALPPPSSKLGPHQSLTPSKSASAASLKHHRDREITALSGVNGNAAVENNEGSLGTESVNSNCSEHSCESPGCDDLSIHEDQGNSNRRAKRKTTDKDGGGVGKKRRHMTAAEIILHIPLDQGWRRETRVYSWLPQKVVGEVTYTTPSGTKVCSVGELKQYLEKASLTDLRDENFSFNANVNVGQFCQQVTAKDGTSELINLTDDHVADRFRDIALRPVAPSSHVDMKLHDVDSEQLMQKMVESLMNRKTDPHGLDLSKLADWQKIAHQESLGKGNQQAHSSSNNSGSSTSKSDANSLLMSNASSDMNMHYYTYLLHAAQQQRHKEQQQEHHKMMMTAMSMEKEQRRQDLLAAKVLEVRKKEEEKERLKEEKKCAKKIEQDRRLAQKRYDLYLALERMRPVEDLSLPDSKTLPKLDRLRGIRLPSKAFANCLSILEFVRNYATVLGLESDAIPMLSTLQSGLLHDEAYVEEFLLFSSRLLKLAIEDPGVVNPKEGFTLSGQKLTDVELNANNISEVMRIFVKSRLGSSDDEMSNWLSIRSFQSLNPTQKASILAFICDELLSNKNVVADIEKSLESISNLRRDKIINEGKLRKLRYQLSRNHRKPSTANLTNFAQRTESSASLALPATPVAAASSELSVPGTPAIAMATQSEDSNTTTAGGTATVSLIDNTDTDSENFAQRSDTAALAVHDSDTEEDKKATAEDLELKIEKLMKQQNQLRQRIQSLSHKLSATCLGQDRYRRRYWVFPRFGGILVEGLESGEPESFDSSAVETDEVDDTVKQESPIDKCQTKDEMVNDGEQKEDLSNACEAKEPDLKDKVRMTVAEDVPVDKVVPIDVKIENENSLEHKHSPDDLSQHQTFNVSKLNGTCSPGLKLENDETTGLGNLNASTETGLPSMECDHTPGSQPVTDDMKVDKFESICIKREKETTNDCCGEKKDATNESIAMDTAGGGTGVVAKPQSHEKATEVSVKDSSLTTRNPTEWRPLSVSSELPSAALLLSLVMQNVSGSASKDAAAAESKDAAVGVLDIAHSNDASADIATLGDKSNDAAAAAVKTVLCSTPLKDSTLDATGSGVAAIAALFDESSVTPVKPMSTVALSTETPSLAQIEASASDNGSANDVSVQYAIPEPGTHPEFDGLISRVSDTTLLATPVEDLIALSVTEEELPPNFLAVPKNLKPVPLDKQRGWWRVTTSEMIKELMSCLNNRGIRERYLKKSLDKHIDYLSQLYNKPKKNAIYLELAENPDDEEDYLLSSSTKHADEIKWNSDLQRKMELGVLKEIDNMEERVCNASLQGWKMPPRVTIDESIELVCSDVEHLQSSQQHALDVARDKLLCIEYNIERRYLKQPFGPGNQLKLANVPPNSSCNSSRDVGSSSDEDSDEDDEDTPTRELVVWRSAVNAATSAAQLWIYATQLNQTIAWEKSIMKVICQICCQDNNEAELLLCDICDRGYHTYCIQPKMENIPDGDWFCYECLAKAAGETPCCLICGQRGSRLATCEYCHRRCHLDCMDPPLARMPKKWTCNSCAMEKGKAIRRRSRLSLSTSTVKESSNDKKYEQTEKDNAETAVADCTMVAKQQSDDDVEQQPPSLEESVSQCVEKMLTSDEEESNSAAFENCSLANEQVAPPRGENGVVEDMSVCRTVLAEMRKHADAWPFQTPVSVKQFPSYRKIVQSPMDFQTISRKLKSDGYSSRAEFATDARRVFVNCELFNEDDSSVGQAGHVMYEFFEKRWAQLTGSNNETDSTST